MEPTISSSKGRKRLAKLAEMVQYLQEKIQQAEKIGKHCERTKDEKAALEWIINSVVRSEIKPSQVVPEEMLRILRRKIEYFEGKIQESSKIKISTFQKWKYLQERSHCETH